MHNDIVNIVNASFRDPSGFLFRRGRTLLRQVNDTYRENYDLCVESGLYDRLISKQLLISHREVDDIGLSSAAYKVLRPVELPFVSYPYEWAFSQLKDAALLTLEVQSICLESGLTLKDASAFNIQFHSGKPIFIDSLSFERYEEGRPWVAYKQFCQHFLGPLTLMARTDPRLRQLQMRYVDGLPLDLVSVMLPRSTHFQYSTWAHIHMHARSQLKHQHDARAPDTIKIPNLTRRMFFGLIASLKGAIEKLNVKNVVTEWARYYENTNYSESSMRKKEIILKDLSDRYLSGEPIVHDLGANTGHFSRIVAGPNRLVVAHDIDDMAVEYHYRHSKAHPGSNVLPLVLDLTNPTPAVGWDSTERASFHERIRGTPVMALALVHHLCISNNVPLDKLANFFAGIARKLIIEFVPKSDSQVKRLLATRRDVFANYDRQTFELEFSKHFQLRESIPVEGSDRVVYYMEQ